MAMVCAGCSSSLPGGDEGIVPEMSAETEIAMSEEPQSEDAQSGEENLSAAVPFDLSIAPGTFLSTESAVDAENGETYRVGGTTSGRTFPSVVLRDGNAFGTRSDTAPGVINVEGDFTPLSDIAGQVKELPGSNPQGLSFEPQNSSAYGDWVVWREGSAGGPQTVPTLESDDWRLVAWDRATNSMQEMASAYLLHGDRDAPYATWDVAPTTDGKYLYFEASVPKGNEWSESILSVPLDSPGKTTVLGEGTVPFADQNNGGVFFVQDNAVVKDKEKLFSVDSTEWQIGKLTESADLLAATVSNGESAWLLIWDIAEKKMIVTIDTLSDWAFPSVAGKTVVWGNGSGNDDPAMCRWTAADDSEIYQFGAIQGLSVPITNGNEVVFPVLDDENIIWEFTKWN